MSNISEEHRDLLWVLWKYHLANAAPAASSPPKSPAAASTYSTSPTAASTYLTSPAAVSTHSTSPAAAPSSPELPPAAYSPIPATAIPNYENSDDKLEDEDENLRGFVISLPSDLDNLNTVSIIGNGEELVEDDDS